MRSGSGVGLACAALSAILLAGSARAEPRAQQAKSRAPVYIEPGPVEKSTLYATGEEVEVATEWVWRFSCGSDASRLGPADLERIARQSRELAALHPAIIPGGVAAGSSGFNLIFNITTSLPAGMAESLFELERYIEAQFSDPVTVVIDFAFSPLPGTVLASTGSSYLSLGWPAVRDGLQADIDANDTIQTSLPAGATIPVRYDGNTGTVTDENIVYLTRANYRAAIGSTGGTAASITCNSTQNWDVTPPSIDPGHYCFQSVIAHEVGHALGFVSGADFRVNDMETLDIYRFQHVESGGSDYNPDDLAEFSTTARMVDKDAPTTSDNVVSDLISVEYRMSDGVPNQASHFHQFAPSLYLMEPARAAGTTFYPNYFHDGDLNMLDAIGWDYPPTNTACVEPTMVKCNSSRNFDSLIAGGLPSPAFSCGLGGGHDGAQWFSFVAEAASANLSTCGSAAQDSTFAVYSGQCGSLVEIVCSEDGGCASPGLSSICATGLTIGETYLVQVSARTSADRGPYTLQVECSCLGACCLNPPALCTDLKEDGCTALGGVLAGGGGHLCSGDQNGDGIADECEHTDVKFSQLPTADEEDAASSADLTDFSPSAAVADEFTSDGRPIQFVRWWGSALDSVAPDGWFVSFHEPLLTSEPAETALGLYFCGAEAVSVFGTPIAACDPHQVIEYEVRLSDCCLLHAGVDSRSAAVPAQDDGFHEELCFDYDLSIQAVVGSRFDDVAGLCVASSTGNTADGDFWGWHTTGLEHGGRAALASTVSMPGTDWLYGPWTNLTAACGDANAAFELITTAPGGGADPILWDNGFPNDRDALASQFGGEVSDWLTVDDIDLASSETITRISWYNEEESDFIWSGRVRLEIYPDNGSMAPVDGAPAHGFWIPDDGGAVTRTDVGPGQFFDRYRYEISGVSIVLGAGRWWLGTPTEGSSGTGRAYWNSSHTQQETPLFFGAESFVRSPSGGFPTFRAWSTIIGGRMSDTAFTLYTWGFADCNCNTVNDVQDIAELTSEDCNANGIPDECDTDCNANLSPDDCDLVEAVSADCEANGVPDECDIFFGDHPDSNEDGIPDGCCETAADPLPEAGDVRENRFISVRPMGAGMATALRVRLITMQEPNPPNAPQYPPQNFNVHEGTYRWVGPPVNHTDVAPPTPFVSARLQCTPHIMDWSTVGVLHIYGPEVIPSSAYEVYAIDGDCVGDGNLTTTSQPVTVTTVRWGDVVAPFRPPATSDQPDSLDVVSLVNKFKSLPGSPPLVAAKLQPAVIFPGATTNALDIASCVDAFVGKAYPYNGIVACPP